jgi:carboxymethylenebutenolidase
MKQFLATLVLLFTIQIAHAQKSCCSATLAFNDISEDKGFQEKHALKVYSGPDLKGEMIDIPVEGEASARVYSLRSEKEGDKYLFVIHEWWGLNDHIKGEADKYFSSLEGVNVIALDLYDGYVATTREQASEYMQSSDQERILKIIDAVNNWTGSESKIATIGWCFGGGWSMQSSIAVNEKAVGCVVYYGMPESDAGKLETLNCKVLGIFASEDLWINQDAVSTYEKAMKSAGKKYETHWFDADHAFANPSNAKYNKEHAEQANALALEFLKKSLKAK